jgi:hypothetical protein
MGWACSTHVAIGTKYKNLALQPEEKRSLLRPIRRWDGNIKMHLLKK